MYNLISQDYLMHHGIKGMKWGVRHDPQPSGTRRSASNLITKRLDARKTSLKKARYKKYSKKNNPISATLDANEELHAYRAQTRAMVKRQKTGKAKVSTMLKRYGNEPVTILGFTGTAKTTRGKVLTSRYPGNGLF